VFQTFLAGSNYHRWMAPVAGEVVHASVQPGLMFSELLSVGWDPDGGTKSTAYEASVNTRGIVIIDSGDAAIGLVAVVPIGITEVSSVKNIDRNGEPLEPGRKVDKGEEIGRFSLGGSTLALVFQPAAIASFRYEWPPKNPNDPPPVNARDWIALAN
jgi:phosphatidylserine decarboxylase